MGSIIKKVIKKVIYGPLSPSAAYIFRLISNLEYRHFTKKWEQQGWKRPDQSEIDFVREKVTIIYKSFERQEMAKRLYRNIQSYYPGVRVIIVDDSAQPFDLRGDFLQVIQLPFNSGLSFGLNRALERVETPYVMRMDDDELLTLKTRLADQVEFLEKHAQIDLVAFCTLTAIRCKNPDDEVSKFTSFSMKGAPKSLLIPHMTQIDGNHFVMGKVPNIYVARTDKVKSIGWDENIRMMDHQDFFWRAAGHLVSVIALGTVVFHYHNPFQRHYQMYRQDVEKDREYIKQKRMREERD